MRGFGIQERLAVGVASVAFLLAAMAPASQASQAGQCHLGVPGGVDIRCASQLKPEKQRGLQVVKQASQEGQCHLGVPGGVDIRCAKF